MATFENLPREIFSNFPLEMFKEIQRYLDTTSTNLWRVADPVISRNFSQRRPKRNWGNIASNIVASLRWTNNRNQAFTDCLCQAVYDDHVVAFGDYLNRAGEALNLRAFQDYLKIEQLAKDPNNYYGFYDMKQIDRLLSYPAAMGGASKIWGMLYDPENGREIDKHTVLALANNQSLFVNQILKLDPIDCLMQLYKDNPGRQEKPRYERRRRNGVLEMVRNKHWGMVDWFLDGVIEQGWSLEAHTINLLVMGCAASGYTKVLDRLIDYCDKQVLVYAIKCGVSDRGIRWLEEYRPELFNFLDERKKSRGMVVLASQRGSPAVLQWLFDRGHANMQRDGWMITDSIINRKYTRTKRWMIDYLTRRGELDRMVQKLLRRLDENCIVKV